MNDTVIDPTEPLDVADAAGAPATEAELAEFEAQESAERFNAHGEALQAELDAMKARNEAQDATRRAAHEERAKAAAAIAAVTPEDATDTDEAATVPLTKLSVEDLQARYLAEVGRPTGSDNKAYLIWKIREAQKGRIPVGPRKSAHREGVTFKVLPLRMESDLVDKLDEAWRRQGLHSRMDLFRRSLQAFLQNAGEADVAAMLASAEA